MRQVEKTVFISYRRTNIYIARAVHDNLVAHGYDVFLDYESIDAGAFSAIILNQIAARAHFVLILTPSALERCVDPQDWLRREIEYAIVQKRNIVPLMFEGFDFRDVDHYLTGQLKMVPQYNGIRMPAEFFDEAMTRLRERFLSKPLDVILHPVPESTEAGVQKHKQKVVAASPVLPSQLQAEEMFERGFTRFNQGKFDAAIADYTEAIRLNPRYPEAYYQRGRTREYKANLEAKLYNVRTNLRQEAKSDYQEALRLSPDDTWANTIRAALYYHDSDFEAAWPEVEEALQKNPHDGSVYYLRGNLYSERGDFDRAIEDYSTAIQLIPNPFLALMERGWALVHKNTYSRAEEDFTKAIQINPQSDLAYTVRGVTRLMPEDKDEHGAMEDLSEAIRINPRNRLALHTRGALYANQGNIDAAIKDFEAVLQIDPEFLDTRARLRQMQIRKGIKWVSSLFE